MCSRGPGLFQTQLAHRYWIGFRRSAVHCGWQALLSLIAVARRKVH